MARVYTLGPMDADTTACGKMVGSTAKASTFRGKVLTARASGTMEGAKNGSTRRNHETIEHP